MLTDDLKTIITGTLETWQVNFGRNGVRDKFADMINPSKFDGTLLFAMINRAQQSHAFIQTAKDNGNVSSFVMPFMAAMAFETVFQSCATFWMSAGDPDPMTPSVLKQSVYDFHRQPDQDARSMLRRFVTGRSRG